MTKRKARSDSKLHGLPPEQSEQLQDWLLAGMSYRVVLKLLAKEYGVKTSLSSLSTYYHDVVPFAVIEKRRRAVAMANSIAVDAKAAPGQIEDATIELLAQKAFELAIAPNVDPKAVKQLFSLVLKARDQANDEKALDLKLRQYEDKLNAIAELASTGKKRKGGISQATIEEIERKANLL